MSIWILTSEYNDYNQYGQYFEGVFKIKPTLEQIKLKCEVNDELARSILSGGQHRCSDYVWYTLEEHKFD